MKNKKANPPLKETSLSLDTIKNYQNRFESSPKNRLAQNAASRTEPSKVALNWDRFAQISHIYSHTVSHELKATAQSQSGRCWIFAFLNMLRIDIAKAHKLEDFQLSQSYLFFWDKIERANYFLESIIETAALPFDGQLLICLLETPLGDGGQWHMAINLVNKYGLMPQSVYPDSQACLNSKEMNTILTLKLRENACILRDLISRKTPLEQVRKHKMSMLEEIFRMLSIQMGTPPQKFDWDFTDKDKKFHTYRNLTPHEFRDKFVKHDLSDYICLVHSPRSSTPFNKTYSIEYLGNIMEGTPILYLNVEIDVMKQACIEMLKHDHSVWMGCDVAKSFHRDLGIMDTTLYDYELFYDVPFKMTKEMRMNFRESQMTHAMLFTGVHLIDGKPQKWRIENSWGESVGKKGYFLMTDDWFNEYMFEVAVPSKYLSKELQKIAKTPPIMLPLWDPLGALASYTIS